MLVLVPGPFTPLPSWECASGNVTLRSKIAVRLDHAPASAAVCWHFVSGPSWLVLHTGRNLGCHIWPWSGTSSFALLALCCGTPEQRRAFLIAAGEFGGGKRRTLRLARWEAEPNRTGLGGDPDGAAQLHTRPWDTSSAQIRSSASQRTSTTTPIKIPSTISTSTAKNAPATLWRR